MAKFKSRKLIAALAGVAVAILGDRAGVGQDALTLAIITVISYITGVALEDGLRGFQGSIVFPTEKPG